MMLLEILVLFLAIPVGYLIAWLAKDELASGKKYFRILIIISILGIIGFWIYDFSYISWTFSFIFIVSLISFVKA